MCRAGGLGLPGGRDVRHFNEGGLAAGIDEPTDEVLFLHGMRRQPDLAEHRRGILHAVLAAFTESTLATVWQGGGGTPDAVLYDLGFKKIAGQPVFARHSTFPSRYAAAHPEGLDVDFNATAEHERWLLATCDDEMP